jgi:hypothetical protein
MAFYLLSSMGINVLPLFYISLVSKGLMDYSMWMLPAQMRILYLLGLEVRIMIKRNIKNRANTTRSVAVLIYLDKREYTLLFSICCFNCRGNSIPGTRWAS